MKKGSVFKKFEVVINILVSVNSLLPKSINKILLKLFRNCPLQIGILIRYILFKNLAKACGKNVLIFPGVILDAPELMDFGNNVSINAYCYLAGDIVIKDDVGIAHTSAIHSMNHTWDDKTVPMNSNPVINNQVLIEEDVWIGCNVIILSGVHIQPRTVIAAGAVVTKSFEGNSIIGGNPARIIKSI